MKWGPEFIEGPKRNEDEFWRKYETLVKDFQRIQAFPYSIDLSIANPGGRHGYLIQISDEIYLKIEENSENSEKEESNEWKRQRSLPLFWTMQKL